MTQAIGNGGAGQAASSDMLELIDPSSKGHFRFIERAHRRSQSAGLSHDAHVDNGPVFPQSELKLLIEKNLQLRTSALPFMETLHEQIVSTHSMVILTDASGTVIEALGDDEFLEKASKVALRPGAVWSEDSKGTNAIGTALIEELPTVVHGQDHFLQANHFLTCSAAPIFDPQGMPIGVLDVTGDQRSYHRHTMGLVRMSAQMIENHLFNSSFQDAIILQFHQRGEFLGSAVEGAAAFAPDGKFLAANRVAMIQFGMSANALRMHTFSSLFGMPLSGLIDHYRACNPENLTLCLSNGNQVIARASLGSVGRSRIFNAASLVKNGGDHLIGSVACSHKETSSQLTAGTAQSTNYKNRHLSSLKYLNTGDPQIAKVIEKVGKVIDKDIPILILGETGTGKEILAQAIHNDSLRHNKPFVAVNCASIPETLIESELFGYEDGAFTGARKKGAQGKIMQANGGTLFLDEIGDMPMPLQARLLRVLQERVVTPLGSQKSYPVNVMVICATHRNLRDLIASGQFREDLYYRLHGLVVRLPALRDRTDLQTIVKRILEAESDNESLTLSAEVTEAFDGYCWPGNIRQLTNILRTASVMASNERSQIEWDDLPDDFLDEFNSAKRQNGCVQLDAAPVKAIVESTNPVEPKFEEFVDRQDKARPRFQIQARIGGKPTTLDTPKPNDVTRFASQAEVSGKTRPGFKINVHGRAPGETSDLQPALRELPARASGLSRFREDRFNPVNRRPLGPVSQGRFSQDYEERGLTTRSSFVQPDQPSPMDCKTQGFAASRQMLKDRLAPPAMNLGDLELHAIQEALEACRGNVSAAARMLGISRNTIYRRLNQTPPLS